MKRILLTLAAVLLLALPAQAADCQGKSIAGLTLGKNVEELKSLLDMSGAMPMWSQEYLSRANVLPMEGYRSGYVVYGNCKNPGRIVRVKMNYADDSEKFFNTLMDALKKRFGKPDSWRGNPFGTLKTWKWAVKDGDRSVSIILQYYAGDDDSFTQGNSIRISCPEAMAEEKACWEAKNPPKGGKPLPAGKPGLEWFLPN